MSSNWGNKYKNMGEYHIGYTPKANKEFFFDSKYFDIVNKYKWICRSNGMIITKVNDHILSLVKLLFGDMPHTYINGNCMDLREGNVVPVRGYKNQGKTFLNGYIAIYMPEHKKAFANGCVYEHILEAEKMLGRQLSGEECVHHKNHNRQDNSHNNLMVFATNKDHIAFHNGARAILTDDKNYITEKDLIPFYLHRDRVIKIENTSNIYIPGKNICPYCNNNIKERSAVMCKDCYNKEKSKNIPPKEELERLIYIESFVSIGKKYGVSDNAVRKWCKKYDLPYRHIKKRS